MCIFGFLFPFESWAQGPLRESPPRLGPNPTDTGWPEFTTPLSAPPTGNTARATFAIESTAFPSPTATTQIDGELFEPAETVAQVGDQYILKGELLGDANLILSMAFTQLEKAPPEERELRQREILEARDQLAMQLLDPAIERKIKYLEFLRSLQSESDPKKIDERNKKIRDQAGKMFAENLDGMFGKIKDAKPEEYQEIARSNPQLYRVAVVMKDSNILSREDPALDRVLRAHGTSLAKQQQAFMEYALGQTAIRNKVNFRPEITHAQMVDYYREHEAEYQVPTKAKWEQLTILFQRIPEKPAAWAAICNLGNEVLFGGTQFWAVAQKKSQEKNASKGGFHDWTPLGDLKISKAISDAVFTYPPNELSPIIEDDEGLHIVRVLERQEAHQTPFTVVQDEIKEKLRTEVLSRAYNEYVAKLRARTPVIKTLEDAASAAHMARPSSPTQSVPR